MLILPAIDLLNGEAVRLTQGAKETAIIYDPNPVNVAQKWQRKGAKWIHVVNLNGAFGDSLANIQAIQRIIDITDIPLELGGGIRSMKDIDRWLENGIARVILGTAAVRDPQLVQDAVQKHGPDKIVVGIDARDDRVAISGWAEQTGVSAIELARIMKQYGVERIIYTDVYRDGELSGPNVTATLEVAENANISIIVSGGISNEDHIRNIVDLKHPLIEGLIIGKALYENRMDLNDIVKKYQKGE